MLARDGICDAMVKTFEAATGELANRLVAALETAESLGGDIRGAQSSAIITATMEPSGHPRDVICNLRVDDSDTPIADLRRLLTRRRIYAEIGRAIDLAIDGGGMEAVDAAMGAHSSAPDDDQVAAWAAVVLAGDGRKQQASELFERALGVRAAWLDFACNLAASRVLKESNAVEELVTALGAVQGEQGE
jgi:hypothetical protein